MADKLEIIEQLECALINCDNIAVLGSVGVKLVKMQIQEAINLLRGEDEDE
jgi:F420-dependent methylenetetrahydromethanopterin dehydrogenase